MTRYSQHVTFHNRKGRHLQFSNSHRPPTLATNIQAHGSNSVQHGGDFWPTTWDRFLVLCQVRSFKNKIFKSEFKTQREGPGAPHGMRSYMVKSTSLAFTAWQIHTDMFEENIQLKPFVPCPLFKLVYAWIFYFFFFENHTRQATVWSIVLLLHRHLDL